MKKIYLVFLTFILLQTQSALSQQWCYPGARWYYTFSGWSWTRVHGYSEVKYSDTITRGGKLCQNLWWVSRTFHDHYPQADPYIVSGRIITHLSQGVLTFYSENGQFDTIALFNGRPGSHWYESRRVAASPSVSMLRFTVRDTGHAVIQGHNLKYLQVGIGDSLGVFSAPLSSCFYIYERIGPTLGFMHWFRATQQIDDYDYAGNFACYSDSTMTGFSLNRESCQVDLVGLSDNDRQGTIIFPNPAHDQLHIRNSEPGARFDLYDARGTYLRPVTVQDFDLSALVPGLYLLSETKSSGTVWHKLAFE